MQVVDNGGRRRAFLMENRRGESRGGEGESNERVEEEHCGEWSKSVVGST